ncbi:Zinc finger protein like [Quillaja saponaria]|uniref:Zinc finger protein like n=1 Tax=Quillaja saponaria TaxID=32244 RepID=A0AAD7LCL5_QUISA|nr:Zinc finger protein like [Quillaja saponaria]
MEFKFREVDGRPLMYPSPSCSSYFSEQVLPASISRTDPVPNRHPLQNPNNVPEAIQRELEKEQIRREIIAAEVARRQMLEAEVRRELIMGREIAMRKPGAKGLSFEERVIMQFDQRMYMTQPFDNRPLDERFAVPLLQSPQAMTPEIRPPSETNKNKLILLAKPDPNLSEAKRKAVSPPAAAGNEFAPFGLKKKPKEDWSCALCQVSATSERGLNEHLQGKKHKAKEAALRGQKMVDRSSTLLLPVQRGESFKSIKATDTVTSNMQEKVDGESLHKETREGLLVLKNLNNDLEYKQEEYLKQTAQNAEDLKNQNGTAAEQRVLQTTEFMGKKKFKFYCEICQVGTVSQMAMESHKKGKKHMGRLKTNKKQLLLKNQIKEDSEKLNGTALPEKVDEKTQFNKTKFRFWCEMCQVVAPSKTVMESHKKGKKHMYRLKEIFQNDGITLPAATIAASEATLRAEVTDVVIEKPNQMIMENVVFKEKNQQKAAIVASNEDIGSISSGLKLV